MLKKQKPLLLIASGGAIALITGAVFGYWLTGQQQVAAELPAGSEVIPQNVLMTLSFTTDPQQWRRLRALGTVQSRALLDRQLVQWRDRLLTANGYSYGQDIQPWVGKEATVALFPAPLISGDPRDAPLSQAVDEQRAAIVLPIANPQAAQDTIARKNPATQVKEQEYKGFKIRELVGADQEDYATTVLDGRFVVVATDVAVATQIIDTYRGQSALKTTAGYGSAFVQTAMPQPLLRLYVNAPIARAVATGNGTQTIPLLALTPLQNNQGVAATVSLEESGLHLRGVAWLPNNSPIRHAGNLADSHLLSVLPGESPLAVTGNNLQQLWQTYSQTATAQPGDPANPNNIQGGFQSLTGLDFNQDLLAWMNGEFSLALVPLSQAAADQKTGLVLLARTSDRPAAERTLKQLDEVMRSRYQYQVSQSQVKGQPVITWVSPFGSLSLTHGWLDDQTTFLGVGTSVAEALLPAGDRSLAANPLLRNTSNTPTSGRFWLNLEQLRGGDSAFPLPKLPPDAETVVGAMRQIAVNAGVGDRSSHFEIRLVLQQLGTPEPLPPPGGSGSNP